MCTTKWYETIWGNDNEMLCYFSQELWKVKLKQNLFAFISHGIA